jgi:hypothetical protein
MVRFAKTDIVGGPARTPCTAESDGPPWMSVWSRCLGTLSKGNQDTRGTVR